MIKLVSVNIEMDKHLDRVHAFLEREKPDVICLQEVFEPDLTEFGKNLGMEVVFGQMNLMGRGNQMEAPYIPFGIGMLSSLPMGDVQRSYYQGDKESAKKYVFNGDAREDCHLFLHAHIQKGNTNFTIGTTHFVWTPDGQTSELQRQDLKKLLAILENIPEMVFGGDFNAPRGGEIFDTIAKHYKDNIPQQYTTSIDANLHRLGDKLRGAPLMVDGLFTTPHYKAQNVRLESGVSDHCALTAEISRMK